MTSKSSSYTRSPMELRLDRQLTDLDKMPPEQRTPVSDCLNTLGIVVLEHEQSSHRHRRDIKEQMGDLQNQSAEALNHLRRLTNGNGAERRRGNNSTGFMSDVRDNWKWILFGAIASGGTFGGLMNFFGFF